MNIFYFNVLTVNYFNEMSFCLLMQAAVKLSIPTIQIIERLHIMMNRFKSKVDYTYINYLILNTYLYYYMYHIYHFCEYIY